MKNLKNFFYLLNIRERKSAGILLLMILVMALLDMIGVASILPFIAVISNPDIIETNMIVNEMFNISKIFGVKNDKQFLFVLGLVVFVLLIISLSFKALTTYAQVRFTQMREYSISKRLIESYLNQPYSWFLSRHSADLGKNILSEVNQVISNGLRPFIELIAKGFVTIAIFTILIVADPKLMLVVSFFIGGAYGVFFYFISKYLKKIGKNRLINNKLRYTSVSEGFGAIKEVKLGGLEKKFVKNFSSSSYNYAKNNAFAVFISQMPRFVLEAIAFGGVVLLTLYIFSKTENLNTALPILSLYVLAGYRVMPALQQIYASLTQLSFVGPSLDALIDDIKKLKPIDQNQDEEILPLNKSITLRNIDYTYPNSSIIALKDVNININAKTTVGLIGATGSGKTTTVDIILGLLEPQKGTLEVDGQMITKKNLRSWQRSIGYVPQHIYLSDDTIEANIAFGKDVKDIDQKAIVKASKIANLHEFVTNELPKKYQTTIGERGIRLSGGQRQRIGIARALYHNPQVLILDEATSALDSETENVVMEAVNNLSKDITIILIAHRLNTVKNCDIIFKLDKGKLQSQGAPKILV